MSRIGKKEISIPEGVSVENRDGVVVVKNQDKQLEIFIHPKMTVKIEDKTIKVVRPDETRQSRSLHGLTRTLIYNAIKGVTEGYEKKLEIIGVGYRAGLEENKLHLKIGFSHEKIVDAPAGIVFEVKKNIITVKGFDKQLVGQVAADIRKLKKPEPYKGKGIKYVGENIIRKVGKAVKGSGTGA